MKFTLGLLSFWLFGVGCRSPLPFEGTFRGDVRADAHVNAAVQGVMEVKLPPVPDAGPLEQVIIKPSPLGGNEPRIALVDVDGLLLDQNFTGLLSLGENPVAAFREKLQAAASDPRVRAVILRVNSPGGSVTASDIMAEELQRFRIATQKPVVACLMDLATGGGYYLAVGADRIIAHPTTITGGVGAILNLYNLEETVGTFNVRADPVKSGKMVDMGNIVRGDVQKESRSLLQEMTDEFGQRFLRRVSDHRPMMTVGDRRTIEDGRVLPASQALKLHLIDRHGYLEDAIAEAEGMVGLHGVEVVQYQRRGASSPTMYGIAPNVPIQGDLIPYSFPGLERSKMPTFLYLWQPDPTLQRQSGR